MSPHNDSAMPAGRMPGYLYATLCVAALLTAGCPLPDKSGANNGQPAADTSATLPCNDASRTCTQRYIQRASGCASSANSGNKQNDDAARQCALENYGAALKHVPATGADDLRTDALIGLADSLKAIRDNAAPQTDKTSVVKALDSTISTLDTSPGGHPYAQYFRADELTVAGRDESLPQNEACARLTQARSTLVDTGTNAKLSGRVNSLRASIDFFLQKRRCE